MRTRTDDALERAERALRDRQSSPADALAAAHDIAERDDVSDAARIVALWAMGLAQRELNLLDDAELNLRAALDHAERCGDSRRAAHISSALVPILAARGRIDDALALADGITGLDDPSERADLEMKRALVLEQAGRLAEAIEAYSGALRIVRSGDDRVLEARLRVNRSIVDALRGDVDRALEDAALGEQLAADHDQHLLAGGAAHNHAFVAGHRGDVVTALASFERADRWYARAGYPGRCRGVLASDRCEVLLVAGLLDEARASAELAVRSLEDVADVNDLAEAQLLLARACLAAGDHVVARTAAAAADAGFRAAGREGWAVAAEFVAIRAAHAALAPGTAVDRSLADEAGAVAQRFADFGWATEAATASVAAAEISLAAGDRGAARRHLRAAARARDRGSTDRRVAAWLATAMSRHADGDERGARRAVVAGLDLVAATRAGLGATELRVGLATHTHRLLDLGLGLALESQQPRQVLKWAERVRANALDAPVVRPPADPKLTRALADLRRQRSELETAHRDLSEGATVDELESAVLLQERVVSDIARIREGREDAAEPFSAERLLDRLGPERALVEYLARGGELFAVVAFSGRCRLRPLGDVTAIARLLDEATATSARLARGSLSAASRAAAVASFEETAADLDRILGVPLRIAADELVVVPTGLLHRVPWGALPSIDHRPLTIAASATRWRPDEAAVDPARRAGPAVVAIAGPELAAADEEAAAVLAIHGSDRLLSGATATVEATLELLSAADVAHLACHGHLRSDSPMFSSLRMADGRLTVYDVEQLTSPPRLVVMPACHSGVSAVAVGDELIGTASALLGAGVGTVVAPITVVNDRATVDVMTDLHRNLRAGDRPSVALARTRGEFAASDDPAAAAAAWSLLCLT